MSACGGLLRDSNGCFIRGFTCNLGSINLVLAQLWSLVRGVRLVLNMSIRRMLIKWILW